MKVKARVAYQESLERLITSNDEEERKRAASMLLMYDLHLCDLYKEIPTPEMIIWWDSVQADLYEWLSHVLKDDPQPTPETWAMGDAFRAKHRPIAKEMFKGKKGELTVVGSFTTITYNTFAAHNVEYARTLRHLSRYMVDVYGLEPLDIPLYYYQKKG